MLFRVSILGASGSIGSAVLREMSRREVTTRAVTRWSSTLPTGLETEHVVADLEDDRSVHDALAGSNVVVFCVSPREHNPLRYAQIKLDYLRRVLTTCREHQIDRFVLVSAADTAAHEDGVVDATHFHLPNDRFGFTDARYQCETEVMLRAADGMNASIMLPYLCVGPTATQRLDPVENLRIFVNDIQDVARSIACECLGTEIGLRRVVVDAHVADASELRFDRLGRPTHLVPSFRNTPNTRRDHALLSVRHRVESTLKTNDRMSSLRPVSKVD